MFTVNGRTINLQNKAADNGMVHTVTTFLTSESWASCGRYIELASTLSQLEALLISVNRLEFLER